MSNEGTVRLLQLTALGPAASEMLIFLLLARHLVNDSSGVTSSLVYAAGLLGVSIMGLLGSIILRKLTRNALGVLSATGLVASSCIPFLFDAGPLDFFVAFLSSFFFAIANSNTNASISSTISSPRRAQEFSKYQTLTNLLVVSAPLLAAALLANYGAPIAFACVTGLHLLAGIPWLIIKIPNAKKSIVEEGLFRQMTTGYRIIVSHAPLRMMTGARMLNNLIYTAVVISSPIIAGHISTSVEEQEWIAAMTVSSSRTGAIFAGIVGTIWMTRAPRISLHLAKLTTTIGLLGIMTIALGFNAYLVVLGYFICGIGQYALRLSGVTYGPSITPPDFLAEVILAGDTSVRLVSLIYSLGLVSAVAAGVYPAILLIASGLCALPAPNLMQPSRRSYHKQSIRDRRKLIHKEDHA